MIRLSFYIGLAIIIALCAAWVSSNPGDVLISWQGWEVRFSVSILILLTLFYTASLYIIVRILRWLNIASYLGSPKRLAAKREKAEKNLDQAWSYYALDDYDQALKFGLRAKATLGEDHNVLRLLAEATRAKNIEKNPYLDTLLNSPMSAPWVQKKQLDQRLANKSWLQANTLLKEMLKSHPKNTSLLKQSFLLTARLGKWQEAQNTLATTGKSFSKHEQKHFKAVIEYALALEEKAAGRKAESMALLKSALKNDPSFSPAALTAARSYIEQDDANAAEKILTPIWKLSPNEELGREIRNLFPHESSNETFRRIKKLYDSAPEFIESGHMLATTAIDVEHWPEARAALDSIRNAGKANQKTYELLALLEKKQKKDEAAADKLMILSKKAKKNGSWQCTACQAESAHYLPTCPECGEFDTIFWRIS